MPLILIPLPSAIATIRDRYKNDPYYSNLFDGDSLKIEVPINVKYKPVFQGSDTKFVDGTQGNFLSLGVKRYGFDIELKDGREAVYNILHALLGYLYFDPCKPLLTTLYDYVQDEGEPDGFKIRQGLLFGIQQRSGVLKRVKNDQTRKLTTGPQFRFLEKDRRFVGL